MISVLCSVCCGQCVVVSVLYSVGCVQCVVLSCLCSMGCVQCVVFSELSMNKIYQIIGRYQYYLSFLKYLRKTCITN